jgi:flagellar hook-associated protein 3 FlgL
MYQGATQNIANARERETISAEKASTNKEIVRTSQDPTGWVQAQNLKDDNSINDTLMKNASYAKSVLSTTENIFAQLQESVERAHELAIPASSNAITPSDVRSAVLNEVRELQSSVLRSLNTRFAGKTLLGGYQTKGPAFDSDGTFIGDQGKVEMEVSRGQRQELNIDTSQVILGKGLTHGVDIPDTMNRLVYGLENNDTEAIRGTLEDLLQAVDQLSIGRSQVAARMSALEKAGDVQKQESIQNLDAISRIEEADPLKAYTELNKDQVVLKAAMSTSQKILSEDPVSTFFK